MTFMKKEVLEDYAREQGINLDGLTWSEQNKLVRASVEDSGGKVTKDGYISFDNEEPEVTNDERDALIDSLLHKINELTSELDKAKEPEVSKAPAPEEQRVPRGKIIMSPEIRATAVQLIKYDEELGDDLNVEEVSYKDAMAEGTKLERDLTFGTYRVKGKTGRRVVAQSTIPKENAGITYDPSIDLVPKVTYNGRTGYIWTHQHYPNVKELLKESGLYHKYKHLFTASEHPENIWYAAGKMLVVNPDVVHAVFREIEGDYRAGKY